MKYLFGLLFLLTITAATAQEQKVYSFDSKMINKYLHEGTSQYLVFIQNKTNPILTGTYLWTRDVKFKKNNGKDVVQIEQWWYASDSSSYRYVYSLVDRRNFEPIYHRTYMKKMGAEAFDFYKDKIVGSDSIADNSKADFTLAIPDHVPLNWELDLETFPLLDLAPGKEFAINFYHPGGRMDPKLWVYKVTGETTIDGGNGTRIPCWMLKIDYSENSSATFYLSKASHEVLKMDEVFPNGVRYKVRLPVTIPVN